MAKRKRRMKYKDRDGVEHVIEDAIVLDLSKGSLEDLIEQAIRADADDEIIKEKANKIREYIEATSDSSSALHRWYGLGRLLQFVDQLSLKDEESKDQAFRRLFEDLKVDPHRKPSASKAARYPGHMYRLAKLPKSLVFRRGMTWSKWFDILEYKAITDSPQLLEALVDRLIKESWSASRLRTELQRMNKRLNARNE